MSETIDLSYLPKRFLEDPISRRWAEVYHRAPQSCLWLPEHVEERLVDAIRLVEEVAGPVGPRVFGRSWIDVAKQYEKLNEDDLDIDLDSLPNDPEDERPRKAPAKARRVSEMEAAIYWPTRYLRTPYDGQRRVLKLWLRCKARRKSFRKAAKRAGWSEATAKRRRWQAVLLIATGLMLDRVEAPPLSPQNERFNRD